MVSGEENTIHVPLFTNKFVRFLSHLDMAGEALGIGADQAQFAAQFIQQHLEENPLPSSPGYRHRHVGSDTNEM